MKAIRLVFLLVSVLYAVEYTCPMHPHILSDREGNCPICGMDLVVLEAGDSDAEGNRSVVTISAETIQNMGVITEKVAFGEFGRQIRAFGHVEQNERKIYTVSARAAGWIGSLDVSAVGDTVEPAMRLYTLDSPELMQAQREYLMAASADAAQRLRTFGLARRTVSAIASRKRALEAVPFYAEVQGVVSALFVHRGSYVRPGMTLMQIDDYSTVWVLASVSEQDAVYLDALTPVEVTQQGLGNIVYDADIDYIYPKMDEKTRTVTIRLVLENPRGLLRPGNVVDVTFEGDYDERLSIPADALLLHSDGSYVVMALGEGRFVPRKIRTGFYDRGRVEVISGLQPGESVVTSGQFMLDSESALRDAVTNMREGMRHDHTHH